MTAHPDAELLAACAAFDELERAHNTVFKGIVERSPEWDAAEDQGRRIQEAQLLLVARLVELRANTLAGHTARARSLALWEGDDPSGDINSEYLNERLLGALLRDLTGRAGA